MNRDELLQAMWTAYTSVAGPRPFRATDAMRAVLDVVEPAVRADEREECAKVCSGVAASVSGWQGVLFAAAAIRARGNNEPT